MKMKVSISIAEETIAKIEEFVQDRRQFRNKSHVIEFAVNKFMEEENDRSN